MESNPEMLLSQDECFKYIKENLCVENAESRLQTVPLHLLNDVISSFHQRVPIQSITLHVSPPSERFRPGWSRVRESVISGLGGLCYELNIFMFALLRGLGYDVFLVRSSVRLPDNHVVTIARNVVSRGDLYLIDAGCGFPTFAAVDLNFEKESVEYYQSFLRYKFVKQEGKILRLQLSREIGQNGGTPVSSQEVWKRNYDFELKPRTLEDINKCFDKVFQNPLSTSSHRVLRCTLFPDQKACALRNDAILKENSDRQLDEQRYNTDDDLVEAICNTFPVFRTRSSLVKNAVGCWRKLEI